MKKFLGITLTVITICVVAAVIFGVVAFYFYPSLGKAIKPHMRSAYRSIPLQISCTIPVPAEHGTLVFLRHGIHPSLSKYQYRLKLIKGSTLLNRCLSLDSRPSVFFGTYWYPAEQEGGPWVRLEHRGEEYLLDLKDRKLSRVFRYKGHVFSGELSGGEGDIAVVESGGRVIASAGRGYAKEITGTSIGNSPGIYLGRIEGNYYRLRFITPGQGPEQR